jgi:hypothetical protein
VARYRAGDWSGAIESLQESMSLRSGGDANDWFVLALAYWRQGDKSQARDWYGKATTWMEKNAPHEEVLRQFRDEAMGLMGRPDGPKPADKERHPLK